MPFTIVRNDITRMNVDAIVNAANEQLRRGGGVCGAIYAAAGVDNLEAACARIGHCETGSAVATPAFALAARHVIHAVGPIWQGGDHGEEVALRRCYRAALSLAYELGDASIALPLISSGTYGYPKEAAIDVAIDEIRAFLADDAHEMDVFLTLFDVDAMRAANGRFGPITALINDWYAQHSPFRRRSRWEGSLPSVGRTSAPYANEALDDTAAYGTPTQAPQALPTAAPHEGAPRRRGRTRFSLDKLLQRVDAGFSQTLLTMIDQRGLKDSDVYKRANMSRQHFSKIRNNPKYQPKKHTVLALAVALRLSLADTRLLLERAGFALTTADARDVIVEYFIERGIYDIYEINLALYAYDQPLLG